MRCVHTVVYIQLQINYWTCTAYKRTAVARAGERPQGANRTREGVAGPRSEAEGASDEAGEA